MKKYLVAFLLLGIFICVSAFLLGGCTRKAGNSSSLSPSSGKTAYQTISPEEAKQKMDSLEHFVLLDVRTAEEFLEQRIEGAILIPDDQIAAEAEKTLPDKDATILVYCRSGRRSALAAQKLAELGYPSIYDFGGIIHWPYETVSGEEEN